MFGLNLAPEVLIIQLKFEFFSRNQIFNETSCIFCAILKCGDFMLSFPMLFTERVLIQRQFHIRILIGVLRDSLEMETTRISMKMKMMRDSRDYLMMSNIEKNVTAD